MKKNDYVRNEEELYRSVRGKLEEEYSYSSKGSLQISSEAFRDRDRKPSVDRAELRGYDPTLSKLSDTDGVISLMTADVRAIGIVKTKIQNEDAVVHAHSQIIVKPELFGSKSKQKNTFKLLQLALAELAAKNGWTVEPSIH
jgi:hypothetical protein